MQKEKLEAVRKELEFVGRVLANGYVDFDTLDELGRSVSSALRLINEYEAAQRCFEVGSASAYRVPVFEPANASS
jgi:hypothetical protein